MNCPVCSLLIEEEFINNHLDECLNKINYIEPNLTKSQEKALKYANLKAKIHSKQTRGIVLSRFINLGYTEHDLNEVLNYIQFYCDVTINCPTRVLIDHIINSPHFKNGYEVARDAGYLEARTNWENNLFNNAYTESAFIERPKYGALNLLKLAGGSAQGYGRSYFVLKSEVKNRITFVNGDSSLQMFHICTFTDPVALLVHLSNQYIETIVNIIKGNRVVSSSHNYIECQIHGLLRLNMDFKKLFLSQSECNAYEINNVKHFCETNNIEFELL
jgi:hypothetical protein